MSITLQHISKHFGAFSALDDINLDIPEGELVALLGPSGCGKTTLLRIIAGLEHADQGQVFLKGDDVTRKPVKNRQIGFVFQHYALFRHMTVFDNIAFGLRVKPRKERPSETLIREKVHALLNLVQLDWLHDRFPDQLSGGQRQRIALARALAVEPSVLLLDEPFGALDASVRKDLRLWLRHLHHELHVTSIFVTHDQEEAMEVASQIVVLNHGKIEQKGTPSEIYDHPGSDFVSRFIGQTNVFHLKQEDSAWLQTAGIALDDPQGIIVHVRPHHIAVEKAADPANAPVYLNDWQHLGGTIRLELNRPGINGSAATLYAEMPNEQFKELALQKGDRVALKIKHAHWFN
ncbi:sulfate ABC transporter ATP-binding protein [Methylicorpusculum oleiharenae]|uniref:sulfate/molybdate ABC transporter ATP-binding protein n=1 Tax=Methylicorpusculum oleiharenae TaxID=1338687 RepID=UPI00135CBB68|nr:sulfate ABC transporter ATP-binding protein [Methylicorpusculum oleiharenae]MCD2450458.1 sulfate ABC transporter ATP-binding protein [Methylicorpusculum oleiharenae]MCD2451530.1 sulfate ABC transporter ATP-binding protein [Methylicorpusculum oleiharenae]